MSPQDMTDFLSSACDLWGWEPLGVKASLVCEAFAKAVLGLAAVYSAGHGGKLVLCRWLRGPGKPEERDVYLKEMEEKAKESPACSVILSALEEGTPLAFIDKFNALIAPGLLFEFTTAEAIIIKRCYADPVYDSASWGKVISGTCLATVLDQDELNKVQAAAVKAAQRLIEKNRKDANTRVATKVVSARYNAKPSDCWSPPPRT